VDEHSTNKICSYWQCCLQVGQLLESTEFARVSLLAVQADELTVMIMENLDLTPMTDVSSPSHIK
jgi:hypothetical protein